MPKRLTVGCASSLSGASKMFLRQRRVWRVGRVDYHLRHPGRNAMESMKPGTWCFEVWNRAQHRFLNQVVRGRRAISSCTIHGATSKTVSQRLQWAEPATAALNWVDDFLKLRPKGVPVEDFVSTHATRTTQSNGTDETFHAGSRLPRGEKRCPKRCEGQETSGSPQLHFRNGPEWNIAPRHEEFRLLRLCRSSVSGEYNSECDGRWTSVVLVFRTSLKEGGQSQAASSMASSVTSRAYQ